MSLRARYLALLIAGALAPAALAQDSTDATQCGGGDTVSPWADSTALDGSEQVNDFVVDLTNFQTRWGTRFGIAPIVKTSKSSSGFNSSGLSSQSMSRLQKSGVDISGKSYGYWTVPGTGVNNTAAHNNAPTQFRTTTRSTHQFGVALTEFGTTDAGSSYNGVVGGIVNYREETPGRLYVERVMAASNSCDIISNVSQFGLGSVDEDGNVFFRADGSGVTGGCGLTPLNANHLYAVSMALRDANVQNVLSNDVVGLKDLVAVDEFVSASADVHLTPSSMPPLVSGTGPFVLTTTFGTPSAANAMYVRGPIGSLLSTGITTFLDPGIAETRGAASYSSDNFAMLSSTHGMTAQLAKATGATLTAAINLVGLDGTGSKTGTKALVLPTSITDNSTFATTLLPAGSLEFMLYESQVAFRGGVGQAALKVDQNGDLLVAATGAHPSKSGSNHPVNMIAVAKVDHTTGSTSWTMAAYNDGTFGPGGTGKPILDGPGGSVIGRLVPLLNVTGGTPIGPSMSPPMFDSVGNIYFLSALEIFDPADFAVGLVRAVYDPATFSYELDLVCKTGDIHRGVNSDRDWLLTFLQIADSNSVASGTTCSQNISETAFADMSTTGLDTADSRALGGLVLGAGIIYDTNDDGDFTTCFNGGVDDDSYNSLLYIGHKSWPSIGTGIPGTLGTPELEINGVLDPSSTTNIEFNLTKMRPNSNVYIVLGFSQINAPFKCGTLIPAPDFIFPALPTFAGDLSFTLPWSGAPANFPLVWQAWIPDPAAICFFASTNGVFTTTP
ncbi:MAG: hypothetical protein H6825_12655 [Planctomycetes bacterium]|nr:hypothetical protein [Planctomycetota bacterium]